MNPPLSNSNPDLETFRAYHLLQYERIDKLESKLESYSNLVITLSTAILTFGYSTDFEHGSLIKFLIPCIVISLNLFGILFARKTRDFVKMHQKRANTALLKFAPELAAINDSVPKPDSENDLFKRNSLYKYIQYVFIVLAIVVLFSQDIFPPGYKVIILLPIKIIFFLIAPSHYSWISHF